MLRESGRAETSAYCRVPELGTHSHSIINFSDKEGAADHLPATSQISFLPSLVHLFQSAFLYNCLGHIDKLVLMAALSEKPLCLLSLGMTILSQDHCARLTNLTIRWGWGSWTRVPFDLEENHVGSRRATGS